VKPGKRIPLPYPLSISDQNLLLIYNSAFGTLLVDLADGVFNVSPERNGDNLAVASSFPPILSKEFAIMMSLCFVQIFHSFPLSKHSVSASIDPCVTANYWIR
jgi:hypothetical protein